MARRPAAIVVAAPINTAALTGNDELIRIERGLSATANPSRARPEVRSPPVGRAAYDGWADWYEEYLDARPYEDVAETLYELLGEGDGTCLDYGCGVGHMLPGIARLGWRAFGIDLSGDMLRRAQPRSRRLARADARRMPFGPETFDVVVTCLTHTDVDDVEPVFREVARVLRTGGRFVTVAVHPCFAGPTATWTDDGAVSIGPGYRDVERRFVGQGVRARVGVRHVPLAEMLTKLAASGFRLDHVVETGSLPTPLWLGVSSTLFD